jgi:prevent-host-death family protein
MREEKLKMASSVPIETTMNLSETKQQLSRVVNSVARGEARVVVEKSGLPVAAIISVEAYRRLTQLEREREAIRARLYETLGRFSDAFDDVPDQELERELAKAQAEARADLRAQRGGVGQE